VIQTVVNRMQPSFMIVDLFWFSDGDLKELQTYWWVNQRLRSRLILSGRKDGVV
jgi:hypothetical protein